MIGAIAVAPTVLHLFIVIFLTVVPTVTSTTSLRNLLFPKNTVVRAGACFEYKSCQLWQNRSYFVPAEYLKKRSPNVVFASARRTRGEQLVVSPGTLSTDRILQLINEQRANQGLNALAKNDQLCQVAQSRTPELAGEIASGRLHSGLYNRDLPFRVTENMKYGGNEESTVRWWLASPIHRKAMLGNYQYTCGTCIGNTCAQLFSNLSPK